MRSLPLSQIIVTIPHSGESIPAEAYWLKNLPESVTLCDVDRFVDQLYHPALNDLKITSLIYPWHRYAMDLNRLADDVDADSVEGHPNRRGTYTTGLHWVKTTRGQILMAQPISQELHQQLVEKYFVPFHQSLTALFQKAKHNKAEVYHIDAHSMPSQGTSTHRDPGQRRPEVVVSDFHGQSCATWYKDFIIEALQKAQFQVAYNWPYVGGRLTQQYGRPELGQHTVQIELRRDLYMDEETHQLKVKQASEISQRLKQALQFLIQ